MAAGGITLEYLSYSGAKDNPGGGCRAVFDFQGSDGGALYVGYTFQIGFDYEPKAVVLANNVVVEGLTGIITEVEHETASYATGKLEIYALQYGTTYDIATFDMSGTPMSDITFTPQANNSIKAKNLVSGTLADDITTSTTNILVHIADNISAQGITDFFPNPPFYITIMPKTPTIGVANRLDSEIIKITNVGHDQVGNAALTGIRAQRDTTAKAFSTGDIVTVGSYCDDAVFLGDDGTTETETPWIGVADIIWSQMIDKIYPVGSIFMSATLSTATAVGNALGGTWTAWGSGRVPVGVDTTDTDFDSAEETGGEKTHTLIVDEIPSHYHNLGQMYDGYHLTSQTAQPRGVYADYAQSVHTTSTGGGLAHNNLQPYITCYMYKRTA